MNVANKGQAKTVYPNFHHEYPVSSLRNERFTVSVKPESRELALSTPADRRMSIAASPLALPPNLAPVRDNSMSSRAHRRGTATKPSSKDAPMSETNATSEPATSPSPIPADRDAAIEQYMPLVKYVVARLAVGRPSIIDHEDILSYGTIGLIEALDRYDDSKGVKFETYAISRIRGAIMDALRALDRLPRSVRQKAKRMEQVTNGLTYELGREPTRSEVARGMEMSLAQYDKTLVNSSWVTVSLDGMVERDESGNASAADIPADPDQGDFTENMDQRETLAALTNAVQGLPERELLIVSLYYKEEMTMKEIAQILEISESRVCQLHGRAIGRLRTQMKADSAA